MDAFDVFKKLTQGARFKRTPKPKTEEKLQEVSLSVAELRVKKEEIQEHDESENYELTLLGHMKADQVRKRKSNRAHDEDKQRAVHKHEINRLRNRLKLKVIGKDVPEPITWFDELPIKTDLIENIKRSGYTEPTTVQKQAITVMLKIQTILFWQFVNLKGRAHQVSSTDRAEIFSILQQREHHLSGLVETGLHPDNPEHKEEYGTHTNANYT